MDEDLKKAIARRLTQTSEKEWKQQGPLFMYGQKPHGTGIEILPAGIYRLVHPNPMAGEAFTALEWKGSGFGFDYKVYGVEKDFIKRIVKSWQHLKGNMGVFLNGYKGSGKTVTMRLIANEMTKLGLPVVIVDHKCAGLTSFLSELDQNMVLVFDEYEKTHPNAFDKDRGRDVEDNSLLTIMDGIDSTINSRLMFLFTTNNFTVSQFLVDRPGRVRYVKEFGNLSPEAITEIVDDVLEHPELRADTIEFLCRAERPTVDNVKSIVTEVNIHQESPDKFASVFNVKTTPPRWSLWQVLDGDKGELNIANRVRISGLYAQSGSQTLTSLDRVGTILEAHTLRNAVPLGLITGVYDSKTYKVILFKNLKSDGTGSKEILVRIRPDKAVNQNIASALMDLDEAGVTAAYTPSKDQISKGYMFANKWCEDQDLDEDLDDEDEDDESEDSTELAEAVSG